MTKPYGEQSYGSALINLQPFVLLAIWLAR